ncbi:MAG: flippase-like domain-containing protein [Candidatus Eremiobacteraeota bacterium]|nr:flippase-like domain-containing protein [Candidatus Eremiobacteraeota bacterium]
MNTTTLNRFLSVLTLVGVVVAGVKYLDPEAMGAAWQHFTWPSLGLMVVLSAFYLLAKAARFCILMGAVTEVDRSSVVWGYAASQAASLLPGGVAFRAATMSQLGVPVEKTAGPVLANSGLDQFFLLITGIVLCYWYPQLRIPAMVLTALLVVLIAVLANEGSRGWVKSALRRLLPEDRCDNFFEAMTLLWDRRVLGWSLLWTTLANLTSFSNLCLVVYALDLPLEPWPLAAAFVIPTLLGRLSPLPAGAGVTEAGMVAFMAGKTSLSLNQAAVATAVFRVVDVILPALYGLVIYYTLWQKTRPAEPQLEEQAQAA